PVAHRVFRHVAAEQPDLPVLDLGVSVFEAGMPVAQALHLGAGEHQATLERLEHLVFVVRPLVAADDCQPVVSVFLGGHGLAPSPAPILPETRGSGEWQIGRRDLAAEFTRRTRRVNSAAKWSSLRARGGDLVGAAVDRGGAAAE